MKKFAKVIGIIIGGLLIIGLILVIIGGIGGGFKVVKRMAVDGELSIGPVHIMDWKDHDWDWSENWSWSKDWDTYDLDENHMFSNDHDVIRDQDTYKKDFSKDEINSLMLELGGCKVSVKRSSDNDFHVYGNRIYALQTYVESDTLYIKGVKTGRWINWDTTTGMEITLEIPGDMVFDEARMELGAGVFDIDTLATRTYELSVGAGQVDINYLEAEDFKCQIGAGQITIEDAKVKADAKLAVGAGEFIMQADLGGDLKAECGLGNMEITVTGSNENDHNYNFECMAGNLTVGSHEMIGLAIDDEVDNHSSSLYDLSCAMGNLQVKFR